LSIFCQALIEGHGDVNYVLMQRRGKLRIKDLKSAVAAKNDENEALEGSMAGAGAGGGGGGGGGANGALAALDDPELDPRVKELIFEREFARVQEFERQKEVRVCVAVGKDPPGFSPFTSYVIHHGFIRSFTSNS